MLFRSDDLDTYYRRISRDPPPVDIAIPFTDVYENLLDVFPLFSEVSPSSSKAERRAAVRSRHGIWRIEVVWQPQAPEDARKFRTVVHEGNCGAVIQRLKTDLMGGAKHVLVVYQFEPEKNHNIIREVLSLEG